MTDSKSTQFCNKCYAEDPKDCIYLKWPDHVSTMGGCGCDCHFVESWVAAGIIE